MKLIYSFSLFYFLAVFISLFATTSFSEKQKSVQFVVSQKILAQWGYASKGFERSQQLSWEKSKFGHAYVYKQKIKARRSVKGKKGVYFRFTLLREDYASEKSAKKRSMKIRDVPKDFSTKRHPEYTLRDGFYVGNKVYIVTTDSVFMQMEKDGLPRVVKLLKGYVTEK